MTTKLVALVTLITFWVFLPFFMMLFNLSGFTEVNTEIINQISADNFNLLTFSGLDIGLTFMFELAKFSISGAPLFFILLFTVFGLISLVVALLFIRGGGS